MRADCTVQFLCRRPFPHNALMPLRETPHTVTACLIVCLLLPLHMEAKTRPAPALDLSYVSALAAADHFLQTWQSGDLEGGIALLTSHAKESSTAAVIESFFSNPGASAYEVNHGKLVKPDRYEFPVVLIRSGSDAKKNRIRRSFSSVVVVNTGNNDWAVDKLP